MNTGRAPVPDNERCAPPFPPIHLPNPPGGNETSAPFHCEESRTRAKRSTDHVSRPVRRWSSGSLFPYPTSTKIGGGGGCSGARWDTGNEISRRWFRSRPSRPDPPGTRGRRSHPRSDRRPLCSAARTVPSKISTPWSSPNQTQPRLSTRKNTTSLEDKRGVVKPAILPFCNLETRHPAAVAVDPQPARLVDRQILQVMAELGLGDVQARPIRRRRSETDIHPRWPRSDRSESSAMSWILSAAGACAVGRMKFGPAVACVHSERAPGRWMPKRDRANRRTHAITYGKLSWQPWSVASSIWISLP